MEKEYYCIDCDEVFPEDEVILVVGLEPICPECNVYIIES